MSRPGSAALLATGKGHNARTKIDRKRNLTQVKLIPKAGAKLMPITRQKQIPGYMGFTRGKKCLELMPQEFEGGLYNIYLFVRT
jgi:hypothetical protein